MPTGEAMSQWHISGHVTYLSNFLRLMVWEGAHYNFMWWVPSSAIGCGLTAGHLQSNSTSDGYNLTKLPFDLSFIKALLMHSKMKISIHIRLVNILYCHPASLALITKWVNCIRIAWLSGHIQDQEHTRHPGACRALMDQWRATQGECVPAECLSRNVIMYGLKYVHGGDFTWVGMRRKLPSHSTWVQLYIMDG